MYGPKPVAKDLKQANDRSGPLGPRSESASDFLENPFDLFNGNSIEQRHLRNRHSVLYPGSDALKLRHWDPAHCLLLEAGRRLTASRSLDVAGEIARMRGLRAG
jgi:hypothetical protein